MGMAATLTNTSSDVSRKLLKMPAESNHLQSKVAVVTHGFSDHSHDWETSLSKKADNTFRPNVSALDALATLATNTISSADNDFRAMPPPPPRRMRSASNPEGMEKWDSYRKSSRRHFVLPSSILEEELASANVACQVHDEQLARDKNPQSSECNRPIKKRGLTVFQINSWSDDSKKEQPQLQEEQKNQQLQEQQQEAEGEEEMEASSTTDDSIMSVEPREQTEESTSSPPDISEDEKDLGADELLRRARSRLLEDLATETSVQKAVLPLPHALDKYKSIYNKNGRIGIYTPLERAAIIAKFNTKRGRRVWNKKIRYNCRKNLADRRMRVKGRFVKRAVEQKAAMPTKDETNDSYALPPPPALSCTTRVRINASSTPVSRDDVDMPDVNDPEAGFRPTASQPYRRLRRHTIT